MANRTLGDTPVYSCASHNSTLYHKPPNTSLLRPGYILASACQKITKSCLNSICGVHSQTACTKVQMFTTVVVLSLTWVEVQALQHLIFTKSGRLWNLRHWLLQSWPIHTDRDRKGTNALLGLHHFMCFTSIFLFHWLLDIRLANVQYERTTNILWQKLTFCNITYLVFPQSHLLFTVAKQGGHGPGWHKLKCNMHIVLTTN